MDAGDWTRARGRVFADLWDLERLASCAACFGAAEGQAGTDEPDAAAGRARVLRGVLARGGSRMTGRASHDVDVAVIGAGFGGALTALALRRLGRSVVLVDRGRHPRFAIGESSTPLANILIEELAAKYDLPRVAPLVEVGHLAAAYPDLPVGLKRGFSFFHHALDRPFDDDGSHARQLLVAASPHDAIADTHWYRPAFDAVPDARSAGGRRRAARPDAHRSGRGSTATPRASSSPAPAPRAR